MSLEKIRKEHKGEIEKNSSLVKLNQYNEQIKVGDVVYCYKDSNCCGATETLTKKSGIFGYEDGSFVIWMENEIVKINDNMDIYLEKK